VEADKQALGARDGGADDPTVTTGVCGCFQPDGCLYDDVGKPVASFLG
jgi:hypothetical protein